MRYAIFTVLKSRVKNQSENKPEVTIVFKTGLRTSQTHQRLSLNDDFFEMRRNDANAHCLTARNEQCKVYYTFTFFIFSFMSRETLKRASGVCYY